MPDPDNVERDREDLDLLIRGFEVSRILRLVADLGIADRISREGSTPVHDLATACAVITQPLIRVLRLLASVGVFRISADGKVSHTPRSLWLRTDTPNSLQHAARFWTGPGSWKAWGELDAAMAGGNPHDAAWNMGRFDYLRQHPDEARAFDAMMANFPDDRHAAIAEAYDFSGSRLIVDLGGGNGEALRQILVRYPNTKGLVFDREDVIASLTPDQLMEGRISAQGGSFFDGVPSGADTYLIIRALHNWSEPDCLRILRTCRSAMMPDAKLLIGERLLAADPARSRPDEYLIDMQMMAMFGDACERTEAEFHGLLEQAGFALNRTVPTRSPISILEAVPIPAN